MKILFWQWHSFMGKGLERALHRLNIAYDTFFYQMNDWESVCRAVGKEDFAAGV